MNMGTEKDEGLLILVRAATNSSQWRYQVQCKIIRYWKWASLSYAYYGHVSMGSVPDCRGVAQFHLPQHNGAVGSRKFKGFKTVNKCK